MKWMVVVGVLASAAMAHADKLELELDAGVRHWQMTPGIDYYTDQLSLSSTDPAVAATVAHRVTPHLAIGGRLAVSYQHYSALLGADLGYTTTGYFYNMLAEPGVAAVLTEGRFWFAPWVGAQLVLEHGVATTCNQGRCTDSPRTTFPVAVAFGVAVGCDLLTRGDSRFGLVVDLELGDHDYRSLGLGGAFRR